MHPGGRRTNEERPTHPPLKSAIRTHTTQVRAFPTSHGIAWWRFRPARAHAHANLDKTADCLDDPVALAEADSEFHDLIGQASGNHALLLARKPLGALLFPAYGTVIERIGPGRRRFEAHSTIFRALDAGDADVALEWMTKHIVDFKRGCELAGLDLDDAVATNQNAIDHPPNGDRP